MCYRQHLKNGILVLLLVLMLCVPAAAADYDNQGFIYGHVVTESGSEYTGFLRWGDQESFWDDLFHSTKVDLPFIDYIDEEDRSDKRRRNRGLFVFLKKLGVKIEKNDRHETRLFISRFGDIDTIEPRGDGEATVRMKNGHEYDVSGYSDDVTSRIHVNDESLGKIELRWDRIESIEFKPAPREADPEVWRLYGTVETDAGDFEGYIQWDKQECLNIDLLDGDTEDGDVSIRMGRIQTIERLGKRSSKVVLKEGRELRLSGTNDVNSDNRGIMVEDPRFGRVTVGWKSFDRLTFSNPPGSGRSYGDYPARGPLEGTVTDNDGDLYTGRIVFDLDESESWEILNGRLHDIYFDIPFHRIAALEPGRHDECDVVLMNGEELTLEDSHDVDEDNSGILIFSDSDEDPVFIKWEDVGRIEFNHRR